jgi:hypothetical protein
MMARALAWRVDGDLDRLCAMSRRFFPRYTYLYPRTVVLGRVWEVLDRVVSFLTRERPNLAWRSVHWQRRGRSSCGPTVMLVSSVLL